MPDPKVDITIGANTTQFAAGLSKATSALRGFLTLGLLANAAKSTIDFGSAINDMAAKAGVATDWLQKMGYAAKQTGSEMQNVTQAVLELRRSQAQALQGSGSDIAAFKALGISKESLRGASGETLFERVALAVQKSGGGAKEVNAALAVMGRSSRDLLPGMLDGFAEMAKSAEELGLIIGDDIVANLDTLGDKLDRINLKWMSMKANGLSMMLSEGNWKGFADFMLNIPKTQFNVVRALVSGLDPMAALDELKKGFQRGSDIIDTTKAAMDAENEVGQASSAKAREARRRAAEGSSGIQSTGSSTLPQADDLTKIGIFVGGASVANGMLSVQRDQLSELRSIRAAFERLPNLLEVD